MLFCCACLPAYCGNVNHCRLRRNSTYINTRSACLPGETTGLKEWGEHGETAEAIVELNGRYVTQSIVRTI
jgi:hypothetical protein